MQAQYSLNDQDPVLNWRAKNAGKALGNSYPWVTHGYGLPISNMGVARLHLHKPQNVRLNLRTSNKIWHDT